MCLYYYLIFMFIVVQYMEAWHIFIYFIIVQKEHALPWFLTLGNVTIS